MSVNSDSDLIKSFILVLGGLVLFTVCIMFLARVISPPEVYDDKLISETLQKRIAPVGQVRTAASAAQDSPGDEKTEVAAKTPQELYDGICASCHATGVAEAPKLEDEAEWAKRAEAGVDALVATVISGKGAMPPNGGSAYSEEEIKSVVQLMLGQDSGASGEAAAEAPAQEAESTDAGAEEQSDSAESGEAAAAPAAAEGGGVPAQVKTAVDTICAACHIAGVAEAPKFGDKEAWDKRAEAGLDAMVATVISGKGTMPPKGGTQLSDTELKQAVEYILSK